MTLDSVNSVALFAGVFLMPRPGHRPHPSEAGLDGDLGKGQEPRSEQLREPRRACLGAAAGGGKVARPATPPQDLGRNLCCDPDALRMSSALFWRTQWLSMFPSR